MQGSAVTAGPSSTSQSPHARWAAHAFTLAALGVWWIYSLFVPIYQLPGPLDVALRMGAFVTDPLLARHLALSLGHVAAAMLISFAVGVAIAMTARYVHCSRLLIDSIATPFVNAFSGIGWLFLGIIWFGVSSVTVIFAVTMVLLPFAIINVRTGLREADAEVEELGRSLTRSAFRRFSKITMPALLPYLVATLRTSFGVSWKVVLTAELFGGSAGVGYLLNVARQEFDTPTIFAIIGFIIVFVATAEKAFFAPVQRRIAARYGHG